MTCRCSGHGETVISILIEFHKFWAYENREVIVVDTSNAAPPALQLTADETLQPAAVATVSQEAATETDVPYE